MDMLCPCAQERALLQDGIAKFPYFDKLYLMLGQLEERSGAPDAARAAYQAGLKRCISSVPLWRSIARLEEASSAVGKARALLEQVRATPCDTCLFSQQVLAGGLSYPYCAAPRPRGHACTLRGWLGDNEMRWCGCRRGSKTRRTRTCGWRPCARSSGRATARPQTRSWPR